ncbi:hypothetical protein PLICRDRAFT_89020 [Plicaturopsis crispa FD-325 SS-3]|nr:hypothetical protein PLICRDRAFT_89020 [Plicaturopsis crispa FD-325 SS-3]
MAYVQINASAPDLTLYGGVVCKWDEFQISRSSPDAPLHCLTRGESIGLTLTAEASIISAIAVLIVLSLIIRNYVHHLRLYPRGKWRLIQEPMDLYMLSLFASDLIQAMGTVLDVKWAHAGKLENGSFCTAQGVVQQLGETSVAMATFAIAIHSFSAVWWSKGVHSMKVAWAVVGLLWLYVVLFVGLGEGLHRSGAYVTPIGTKNTSYETPTPYWCWVGSSYGKERIWGEYFWLWLTLATSIIVYIPLYFWKRGNLDIDGSRWFSVKFHRTDGARHDPDIGKRRSFDMLAYPLVYCVIVLPLSIVRWYTFDGKAVPSVGTFFVIFVYGLSGFFNVLLFLTTRPHLLLFTPRAARVVEGLPPSSTFDLPAETFGLPAEAREEEEEHAPVTPALRMGCLPDEEDSGWTPSIEMGADGGSFTSRESHH